MYLLNEIKTLHLEMTEKCQAACPFCARMMSDGNVNNHLINAEITINKARQFFSKDFIKQLNKMYMCGVYGDPIIAQDTLDVLEYFRYNNKWLSLGLHTNGGARTADWWKDLASIMYNENSDVTFSIDGLEDTNHIYRKNVSWDIVMNSASTFIEAGGNALWSFIVFRHNEHQVETARALAKKMGFKKFVAKKSSRFVENANHKILPPTNTEHQNANIKTINKILSEYGTLENFYDHTTIDCMVAAEKNIYVSARGFLFPCCWLAAIHHDGDTTAHNQLIDLFERGQNIDLNKHSLQEVFDSGIFERIKKSWSCSSTAKGKLIRCAKTCSKDYNFFKAQFT